MDNLRDTIFYMKTNVLQDFHICISESLMNKFVIPYFFFTEYFFWGVLLVSEQKCWVTLSNKHYQNSIPIAGNIVGRVQF